MDFETTEGVKAIGSFEEMGIKDDSRTAFGLLFPSFIVRLEFSKSSLLLQPPSSHSVAVGFLLIFIYRADTS
ncbi:hypothetical protein L195_g052009 [Trifolium pratense]|uniref:Uncharacterized protein n=1 Tax=Trifolium pratense TaxID=57577 RepID=A0A2K3K2U7_TRIPR|nr:hypothetical protein L195_g052009 [Trifolium pratense]